MKPFIGITCNYLLADQWGFGSEIGTIGQDWDLIAGDYIYAVERAGGIPVVIPLLREPERAVDFIARLDGLIISGGNDVDPLLYGERPGPKIGAVSDIRDRQDLLLTEYAVSRSEIPVLGICRGIQILNVAFGGTLYQDLESEGRMTHSFFTYPRDRYTHGIRIEKDSLLYELYRKEQIQVNSFHHQAVKQPGRGLTVSGVSEPDGVIEALEYRDHPCAIGIQWHPEMLGEACEDSVRMFRNFIGRCSKQ